MSIQLIAGIIFLVALVLMFVFGAMDQRSSTHSSGVSAVATGSAILAVLSGVAVFIIWASNHVYAMSYL